MISLVELAVRVGGLKVNGLPATNFEHHFAPTFVNTGKELVLFDTGNGTGGMATAGHLRAARSATACASSMMQRLSKEMRGGQRSRKSTGSRSFELWFRRDRAVFRPVRSRLPVGIAPNNLSFHLDRQRHAGLITVVRKRCWKTYSARGEIMKNLLDYLTDDCSPRKRVLGEINDVEMRGVDRLPLWSVARTRVRLPVSGS